MLQVAGAVHNGPPGSRILSRSGTCAPPKGKTGRKVVKAFTMPLVVEEPAEVRAFCEKIAVARAGDCIVSGMPQTIGVMAFEAEARQMLLVAPGSRHFDAIWFAELNADFLMAFINHCARLDMCPSISMSSHTNVRCVANWVAAHTGRLLLFLPRSAGGSDRYIHNDVHANAVTVVLNARLDRAVVQSDIARW